MSKTHPSALILFARDPILGQVKTRLKSLLNPETTLSLYTCFLEDTLATLQTVQGVDHYAGVFPSLQSGFFDQGRSTGNLQLFLQQGEDLGERMENAFRDRFLEGYERVVIIGADSPTLPPGYIEQALSSPKQVALGPSTDGGYYLIGMNRSVAPVFDDVDWGTPRVLAQTLSRLTAAGVSLDLLPVWYDVDYPEELRFLKTHLQAMNDAGQPGGEATRRLLNTLTLEAVS